MSLFEKYPPNRTRTIKAGNPCLNCPAGSGHTHRDHSMNAPQICLIEGCPCKGLKLDLKPIAPNA